MVAVSGSLGPVLDVLAKPHDDKPRAMSAVMAIARVRFPRMVLTRISVSPKSL